MEEIPEFMVGLDDIWGNITDEEIVATIVELEQENEAKTQETKQASPAVYTPVAPPPTSTSRFASLSDHIPAASIRSRTSLVTSKINILWP